MNENDKQSGLLGTNLKMNGAASMHEGQPDDLHDLFGEAKGADEDDPLAEYRNDPNYAALIKELEYIAAQARLLFEPAQEAPSDEVWKNIQTALAEEPRQKD